MTKSVSYSNWNEERKKMNKKKRLLIDVIAVPSLIAIII